MVAITQLDEWQMAALLERYELGELSRHWPASRGIENTNYFVELRHSGKTRQYVVTLIERGGVDPFLVALLERLDAAGLPVPALTRNRFGAAYETLAGKPVMVTARLPGRHPSRPSVRQCAAVGRFMARMHSAARPLTARAAPRSRDAAWLARHLRSLEKRVPFNDAALMRHCVGVCTRLLARRDVQALPRGIIHGDLFRDNALFMGEALTGVVDFHQSAAGYWLYDLAVAVNDWCVEPDGSLDPDRTLALLRAYHGIRPLLRPELWFFATFTLYAALAFWQSRAARFLAKRPDAEPGCPHHQSDHQGDTLPAKDPEEFKRILEQRLTRPFSPDPARLERSSGPY